VGPDDTVACFAGLHNGLAFNASLLPALLTGACLHLSGTPFPTARHVARVVAGSGATVLVAPPAVYETLAASPRDLGARPPRLAFSSAARLSAGTRRLLQQRDGLAVSDYYGLAETGPVTAGSPPAADGQGPFLPHASGRIEQGELLVRTTSMGTRYLNHPGLFESRLTADGYYRTRDEARLDATGLHLGQRLGKGINIGGRKISPDAVRHVLMRHPAVGDAHVLGHQVGAEPRLVTLVVLSDAGAASGSPGGTGPAADLPARLRAHCAGALAPHEVPSRFHVVDGIPRSGVGKPREHEIAEILDRLYPQPLEKR
jgi:acyl-coenzyme A synthetase/AMP-(fatty) acid ligase